MESTRAGLQRGLRGRNEALQGGGFAWKSEPHRRTPRAHVFDCAVRLTLTALHNRGETRKPTRQGMLRRQDQRRHRPQNYVNSSNTNVIAHTHQRRKWTPTTVVWVPVWGSASGAAGGTSATFATASTDEAGACTAAAALGSPGELGRKTPHNRTQKECAIILIFVGNMTGNFVLELLLKPRRRSFASPTRMGGSAGYISLCLPCS